MKDTYSQGSMHWLKISCILCLFGCFKDFRPSESFITDYLTGPWKNFTTNEVNQDIYPVTTYSYLATLILVFLITDFVRYKLIIILCGLSGIITYLMIIFGKTVMMFQIVEFFYGLFFSTEVAYYTYIYAKVDKKHYQEVTSHTKAATLFGRSLSGIVAQLTASFNLLDYHQLNYLTLSASTIATVWSFFLPSVGQSIYFHRASVSDEEQGKGTLDHHSQHLSNSRELANNKIDEKKHCCYAVSAAPLLRKIRNAYALLWKHFVQAYTDYRVVKWSVWWALATCGYLQVINYMQLLWQTAVGPNDMIYNGAVDFIYAIVGAVTVFCVGKVRLNWTLIGDIMLSVFSLLEGVILLASSYSHNIWLLYAAYVTFGVIYHTMVTVASFEVAKCISEDSYGLIFGVNTFFALLAQSLLTLVVVNTLLLDIRQQFFVYGGYFVILAVVYVIMGIINIVQHRRSDKNFHLWINDDNKSSAAQNTSDITSFKSEQNDMNTIPLLLAIGEISAQCLTGNDVPSTQDPASKMSLTDARFGFALDSMKKVAQHETRDNIFFSPQSIHQALSLAYFGTRGTTEEALKQALRIPNELSKVDVQRYYAYEKSLNEMRSQMNGSAQSYEYKVANRFWITNSKKLRECMLDFFGDQLQVTDFRTNPEEVRNRINNWVSNMTKNHIRDLLPPDSITEDTDLVLANAVYFKGLWAQRFDPKSSKRDIFYSSGTQNSVITFMRQKGNFNHVVSDELGVYILELPYKGDEISMFVLLPPFSVARSAQNPSDEPRDGIRQLVERLATKRGSQELRKWLDDGMLTQEVELSLPRFEIERELPIGHLLHALGAGELLSPAAADLRGFVADGEQSLHLGDAVHRARIEVTEEGTTAAAATAIFSFRSSRPIEPVIFNANHPFIYLIYDKQSHSILFTGIFRTPGAPQTSAAV
nr:PREDICTED: thiamine transporter 2-like [Linepithema humile]